MAGLPKFTWRRPGAFLHDIDKWAILGGPLQSEVATTKSDCVPARLIVAQVNLGHSPAHFETQMICNLSEH